MLVVCSRGVHLSLHLRVLSSSISAQAGMNCSIGHKARQSAVNILRPNTESMFAEQGDWLIVPIQFVTRLFYCCQTGSELASSAPSIPFRVSDPDEHDCAERCPTQLHDQMVDENGVEYPEAWLCPEGETNPKLSIVTPRPGSIISTNTQVLENPVNAIASPSRPLYISTLPISML